VIAQGRLRAFTCLLRPFKDDLTKTIPWLFYATNTNVSGPTTVFTDRFWDEREHWQSPSVGLVYGSTKPYFGPLPPATLQPLQGTADEWLNGVLYSVYSRGGYSNPNGCAPTKPVVGVLRLKQAQTLSTTPHPVYGLRQVQELTLSPRQPAKLNQVQRLALEHVGRYISQAQTIRLRPGGLIRLQQLQSFRLWPDVPSHLRQVQAIRLWPRVPLRLAQMQAVRMTPRVPLRLAQLQSLVLTARNTPKATLHQGNSIVLTFRPPP
jgi:hypothetical protein